MPTVAVVLLQQLKYRPKTKNRLSIHSQSSPREWIEIRARQFTCTNACIESNNVIAYASIEWRREKRITQRFFAPISLILILIPSTLWIQMTKTEFAFPLFGDFKTKIRFLDVNRLFFLFCFTYVHTTVCTLNRRLLRTHTHTHARERCSSIVVCNASSICGQKGRRRGSTLLIKFDLFPFFVLGCGCECMPSRATTRKHTHTHTNQFEPVWLLFKSWRRSTLCRTPIYIDGDILGARSLA